MTCVSNWVWRIWYTWLRAKKR